MPPQAYLNGVIRSLILAVGLIMAAAVPALAQLIPPAPEDIKRAAEDHCRGTLVPFDAAERVYCSNQLRQLRERERLDDLMAEQRGLIDRVLKESLRQIGPLPPPLAPLTTPPFELPR